MADDKKIARLFKIYQRLKRGPVTIEVLRAWCRRQGIDVSDRTLYRDLEDLSLYFETDRERIVTEKGEFNKTTWRLVNRKEALIATDSLSELLQKLFIVKNLLPAAINSVAGDSVERVAHALLQTDLKNAKLIPFEAIQNAIFSTHWGERDYEQREQEIVFDMIWAIENKRQAVIAKVKHTTTESADIPDEITVNPLQIFYHRGAIYLCFEWDEKPGDILLYELEVITRFVLTDKRFNPVNTTEKIAAFLASRFGVCGSGDPGVYTVKLLFPHTTNYKVTTQRFWHPTQRYYRNKEGELILEFESNINRELAGFVMMYLDHIQVLAPRELVEIIARKAETIAKIHKGEAVPMKFNHPYDW